MKSKFKRFSWSHSKKTFVILDRYVITPYIEYPQLLGLLLKLLNGELAWSTRREVLKVSTFVKLTIASVITSSQN